MVPNVPDGEIDSKKAGSLGLVCIGDPRRVASAANAACAPLVVLRTVDLVALRENAPG